MGGDILLQSGITVLTITPTAEPFFFPGADRKPAVLLIHGFTGTPKEVRWMGEYLNRECEFACLGIRLAGHATRPEAMIRTRFTDWLDSVEDGFDLLSHNSARIYLAGLSMGGALALTLSTRLPARGVIAMATPFEFQRDWRLRVLRLVALVRPHMRKGNGAPGEGWFDHAASEQHVSYPRNPTHSIGELNKLLSEMRATLPQVQAPVLLIHSRDDDYVSPAGMSSIYERLGAPDKRMLWIEGSGHVITEDAQRESVFRAAADFITDVETAGPEAPGAMATSAPSLDPDHRALRRER